MNKYLIIRFSSFGDIVQALPAAQFIRQKDPSAEIHWLTRSDFCEFVKSHSVIDQIWSLERKDGLRGLLKLASKLKSENYTHVYDAHSNLRSLLLSMLFWFSSVSSVLRGPQSHRTQFVRRSKDRLNRWLLFSLRINRFAWPYRGARSYLQPLKKWFQNAESHEIKPLTLQTEYVILQNELAQKLPQSVVIAPSATWELKRWPIEYWSKLVQANSDLHFVILGGEHDTFCDDIAQQSPHNTTNLRGRLTWLQSAKIVSLARAVVSGDTGILHLADVLGRPTIGLIGPTAFGYPSLKNSQVIEIDLPCKPCSKDGRGRCRIAETKKCLVDIKPEMVSIALNKAVLP
jgi:ADP-heptose:LPS heptosyltransferase